MLSRFVAILPFLLASPAHAIDTSKLGSLGSLLPEEKEAMFAKSPKLKSEVAAELAKLGKTVSDVPCDGIRFPGAWKALGGVRVAPYTCQFGDRELTVKMKVVVTGKGGKVYPQINREAMQRATDVRESDPTWTWSDRKPEKQ